MPRCGATFDETSVSPWTRGDFQGGLERANKTHPGASRPLSLRATPPTEGIFRGGKKDGEISGDTLLNRLCGDHLGFRRFGKS